MDPVQVYKLYRETESEVASLERCVREGKELDCALAFCRYVFWSGIVEILKAHQDVSVVKIDPYRLGGRVNELQSSVQEWYASNKKQPTVVLSEIEGISRKLDLIAGRLLWITGEPR